MLQKTAKGNLHWSIDVREIALHQGAAVLEMEFALEHRCTGNSAAPGSGRTGNGVCQADKNMNKHFHSI